MVTIKTMDMSRIVLPMAISLVRFATEEAIAKKSKGIMDTNKRFKKISPKGLMNGIVEGANSPSKLPQNIPIIKYMRFE